jgi:hypothetical protein
MQLVFMTDRHHFVAESIMTFLKSFKLVFVADNPHGITNFEAVNLAMNTTNTSVKLLQISNNI